jgi:hypothetical protein
MDDLELCALRAVIDYLWTDEQKDYSESGPEARGVHIYHELITLKRYLQRGAQ